MKHTTAYIAHIVHVDQSFLCKINTNTLVVTMEKNTQCQKSMHGTSNTDSFGYCYNFMEHGTGCTTAENEYKSALNGYIRYGTETKLEELERKSSSIKADAGYSVTTEMQEQIYDNLTALNPLRQFASVAQISGDALEVLDPDTKIVAGWSDAGLEEAEKTSTMQFKKQIIPVHELYAQAKTTQKLLDDTHVNIEEWLTNALVEAFHRKESEAFFSGDGNNKPLGFLSSAVLSKGTNINTTALSVENLIALFYSLPDYYARNAKFIMHRTTAEKIMMLKDESGRFVWQQYLSDECSGKIMGLDVVISPNMPRFENGNTIIALGDFKRAYQIIDKNAIRILRDPFTDKPLVKFYAYKCVGGGIILPEAMRFLSLQK